MAACYLRILFISLLKLYSTEQTSFACPKSVAFRDSAELTCSNLQSLVSITNPAKSLVGSCTNVTCGSADTRISIALGDNTLLLTVQEIDKEDEGQWTCQSKGTASCFLNVFKLPSCEISSTSSTNNLSLGQDLPVNINLTDYYCTNRIKWNLRIGEQFQNVTEFQEREDTGNITSMIVTYSSVVTSSLVELTFNSNDEAYDVSCSAVEELQLRGKT